MRLFLIFMIALLSLLLCTAILAQDIEYINTILYTGPLTSVQVDDCYAYCTGGQSLHIVSLADPANPHIVGGCVLNEYASARDVFVSGNYAYITDSRIGLQIINISDPLNPLFAGSYSTISETRNVFVSGNFAYVTWRDFPNSGFDIIDISDPSNPIFTGCFEYYESNEIRRIFVSDRYAYVDTWYSLQIIDVFDPSNPTFVGGYNFQDLVYDIFISGNYAYAANDDHGLQIIDISDPSHPTFAGSYETMDYARNVFIAYNYAYVEDSDSLLIIDISNPLHPMLAGSYDAPIMVNDIFVSSDYAYLTGEGFGLQVIDASAPSSPSYTGSYEPVSQIRDFFIADDRMYVNDSWKFLIIDVIDPMNPTPTASYNILQPGDIFVVGDYAYVAWGVFDTQEGGLEIVDVSDPSNPIFAGNYDLWPSFNVYISGNYAYVSWATEWSSGFVILDISNPLNPTFAGEYNDAAGDIFVSGTHAYLAMPPGLYIVDVSDPSNPTYSGSFDTPRYTNGIFVSGNYAYVIWGDYDPVRGGLEIIDISNPSTPSFAGQYDFQEIPSCIFVEDNFAYIGIDHSSLQIINVSDPASPIYTASYDTPDCLSNVFVSDNYIYVDDIYSLMILRFDPESGIEEIENLPIRLSLYQNHPNPFNSSTAIKFDLPQQSQVTIEIYDILGRKVSTLVNKQQPAGYHQAIWRADDFASGMYFYKLQAGDFNETKKMILMK